MFAREMRLRYSVGAAFLCGLTIVIAYVLRTRCAPVLYAVTETGDPVSEPTWSILNPLRDRSPERAADEVLEALRRGRYDEGADKLAEPPAQRATIVQQEREHPLRAWKLIDREDTEGAVTLFYRRAWGDDSECDAPLWVSLRRRGDRWGITSFRGWY